MLVLGKIRQWDKNDGKNVKRAKNEPKAKNERPGQRWQKGKLLIFIFQKKQIHKIQC